MTREGELVLVFALHVPLLCRLLHALAHRQSRARLHDARKLRREMLRAQPEPRHDAVHRGPRGVHVEQDVPEFVTEYDGRVADGVGAACNPAVDLAEGDLVGNEYCRLDAGPAGALQVHSRGLQGQPGIDHALAGEIPVAGVLDNGAQRDVAHGLAAQVELVDEPLQGRRHEVLVGALPVNGMGATEGDARAADNGNANGTTIVQHNASGESVSHEREATLHY